MKVVFSCCLGKNFCLAMSPRFNLFKMAANKSLKDNDVTMTSQGGAESQTIGWSKWWCKQGVSVWGWGGVRGDVMRGLEELPTPFQGAYKKLGSCVYFL